MVKNHLSKLLGERRWSQAKLAKMTGIRPGTINELYHEIAVRISIEHIDQLCTALNCTVSDLFEHIPDHKNRAKK